jgi:hypothetical protein
MTHRAGADYFEGCNFRIIWTIGHDFDSEK